MAKMLNFLDWPDLANWPDFQQRRPQLAAPQNRVKLQ
jgi:hypothetical protein